MKKVLVSLLGIAALVASIAPPANATVRTYYIAADEVVWNYVPLGRDIIDLTPTSMRICRTGTATSCSIAACVPTSSTHSSTR